MVNPETLVEGKRVIISPHGNHKGNATLTRNGQGEWWGKCVMRGCDIKERCFATDYERRLHEETEEELRRYKNQIAEYLQSRKSALD